MYLIFVILCAVAVKNGVGQSYNHHHPYFMGQGQYSPQVTTTVNQYRDYPFSHHPGSGGVHQNGRLGSVKASNFPPNFYDHYGSQSIPHASLTSSSVPTQPSSYYSGFYYAQDKPSRGPQPAISSSSPFVSNMFSPMPADSTHSSLSSMTPAHLHSIVLHQPPPPPTSSYQQRPYNPPPPPPQPQFSRLPGFPSSKPASMDTYQEALDLFSEVVNKLEKEPGSPRTPSYSPPQLQPMPQHGIYGTPAPPPGFPRHLDHIMGPDFLQRAQKLYTKIIKEQNERLLAPPQFQPPSPSPIISNQKYSMYHHPGNRNSIQYSFGQGAPHFESLVQSPPGPTMLPYGRPSYLARNMNLDHLMDNPLLEAVKSIEIPMGRRDDSSSDEMMQTSESIHQPIVAHMGNNHIEHSVPPPHHHHNYYRQMPQIEATTTTTTPPPPPPPPQQPTMGIFEKAQEIQPPPKSYHDERGIPLSSLDLPPRIPISENDYVEHPLPYEEYEGLVRDIAINHNY